MAVVVSLSSLGAWPNGKCLAFKQHQTLFGDQPFYRFATLSCAVWSCLRKFEGHQTFDQTNKPVLFVWPGESNMFGACMRTTLDQPLVITCFLRICDPYFSTSFPGRPWERGCHSSLLVEFDLSFIKYVLTDWPLASTFLAIKQCLMLF